MTHPERVEDYLEHIADAIERAMRYVGNLENLQALEENQQAQDAIVRTITVVGEAANRICKVAPDFVTYHPGLPWSQMRGIATKSFTTTSMSPGTSSGIPLRTISRRSCSKSGLCCYGQRLANDPMSSKPELTTDTDF
jgi:uncharacterized protein with HEPN domain